MDFGTNKMPIEVIKEGAFGGTYFRDIYSSATGKLYKKSWKEFHQLKDIMMLVLVNLALNLEHR